MRTGVIGRVPAVFVGLAALLGGCGGAAGFLNPTFVNFLSGGVYPLTPGPGAGFVLVRTVNETDAAVRFFVTIERIQPVLDADGLPLRGEAGAIVTENVLERVQLTTEPTGRASELGTLFPCSDTSPIIRVGLGENLLPSDPAVFVIPMESFDPEDPYSGQAGYGIRAEEINPLLLAAGNYICGDTIIFRTISSSGKAGGVKLETFLLPSSDQPSEFSRHDTFANFEEFLESQVREEELP